MGREEIEDFLIEKKYLTLQSNRSIFFSKITKKNIEISASIIYCHGLGEHSMRNIDVACRFCEKGYEVNMLDFSGYGFSYGERAFST